MTRVTIRIPTPLRPYTQGAGEVELGGETVGDCLAALDERYAGIGERIFDEHGELRRFVNVFLGPVDVRALQGLATPLEEGKILTILPAVAGGRSPGGSP